MGPRRKAPAPAPQQWWVRQGEDVQGPFALERMRAWLRTGKLQPDMLVSPDGERWGAAGRVSALTARGERTRTRGWEFHRVMKAHTPQTYVTYAILGLNTLVSLAMITAGLSAFSPTADALLAWGGNYGPRTTNGEWWRLVTCTFVHGGLFHLFGNMLFFWYIGRFMERLVGQSGYVVLYLGSGIAGSLASLAWNASVVSVGASGALFGLFGGVLGFVVRRDHDRVAQAVLRTVKSAAVAFLIWQIVFGLEKANVDHAGHIGGVLGGFGLGYLLGHPLTEQGVAGRPRRAAITTAVCLAAAVLVGVLLPRYDDLRAVTGQVVAAERRLLPLYRRGVSGELPREELVKALEEQIIPGYQRLDAQVRALEILPRQVRGAAEVLKEYIPLRLEAFKLRLLALSAAHPVAIAEAVRDANEKEQAAGRALARFARELGPR